MTKSGEPSFPLEHDMWNLFWMSCRAVWHANRVGIDLYNQLPSIGNQVLGQMVFVSSEMISFIYLPSYWLHQSSNVLGSGWVFSASFPELCQILCCTLKKNSKTNRNSHRQTPIKWFSFNWYLCCGSSQTRIREIIWRGTTRPRDLYLQPFEFFVFVFCI